MVHGGNFLPTVNEATLNDIEKEIAIKTKEDPQMGELCAKYNISEYVWD